MRLLSSCSFCLDPLLFFELSAHHQDLHSFPTRRSSDLILARSRFANGIPSERKSTATSRLIRSIQTSSTAEKARRRDRKSTRLNSSHRCISYAVFCLKKKNNNKR